MSSALSPHPVAIVAPPALLACVAGLSCRRGRRRLFEGLDLSVAPGEAVWLRGRNGSGKTSLLRLLAGLGTPECGELAVASRVVYVGHATALHADLSAAEALSFLLARHGSHGHRADASTVHAALCRVGAQAQADVPVLSLSAGQRRRIALARLAAETEPSLWLLDEPLDALDADGAASVTALIEEHLQRGGAAIVASHHPFGNERWTPRVVDLDRLH